MFLTISRVCVCLTAFLVLACGHKSNTVRDSARESLGVDQQAPATNPPPAAVLPGTPEGLVNHYTCPNNCAGSGAGEAGTCPVCGTAYVHNQAFHNQTPATTTQKMTFPGSTTSVPADGSTPPVTPPTPEPAQNAGGVWHYTCANGCEGGAGGAGSCPKGGGALAHNSAYHQ